MYEINTIVKIRPEWLNSPDEAKFLYRVINYNPVTDRYIIECINTGMSLNPTETVAASMIEKI